jgi:hypothetical protein
MTGATRLCRRSCVKSGSPSSFSRRRETSCRLSGGGKTSPVNNPACFLTVVRIPGGGSEVTARFGRGTLQVFAFASSIEHAAAGHGPRRFASAMVSCRRIHRDLPLFLDNWPLQHAGPEGAPDADRGGGDTRVLQTGEQCVRPNAADERPLTTTTGATISGSDSGSHVKRTLICNKQRT